MNSTDKYIVVGNIGDLRLERLSYLSLQSGKGIGMDVFSAKISYDIKRYLLIVRIISLLKQKLNNQTTISVSDNRFSGLFSFLVCKEAVKIVAPEIDRQAFELINNYDTRSKRKAWESPKGYMPGRRK